MSGKKSMLDNQYHIEIDVILREPLSLTFPNKQSEKTKAYVRNRNLKFRVCAFTSATKNTIRNHMKNVRMNFEKVMYEKCNFAAAIPRYLKTYLISG